MMMNERRNISEGQPLSRILTGEKVSGAAAVLEGEVFVVCDRAVRHLADDLVRESRSLAETGQVSAVIRAILPIDASEAEKGMDTVLAICRWLLESGADRSSLLLAIGGGITTDMAGFAASIYKRGIRFAFIPTTLLAQVDAAIGGKTGVNFMDFKNMLGVIRQPEWTWICPEPLRTLPLRDFRSGAAELLKTFLLENRKDHYARSVRLLTELCGAGAGSACPDTVTKGAGSACFDTVAMEAEGGQKAEQSGARPAFAPALERELQDLIAAAAAVKAGVVSRDAEEHGERRILNLGHTFAHGIEWAAQQQSHDAGEGRESVTHGEAVAIGIVLAARLAEKLGLAENSPADPVDAADERERPGAAADFGKKGLAARLTADFTACGLPTESPFPLDVLETAMAKDKKADGSAVRFILPVAVGKVVEKRLTVSEALTLLGKGATCSDGPRDDASLDLPDTGASYKKI